MSDPFYAEIRFFGFSFPPVDWAVCNGATVLIQQNPGLYALLGQRYGYTASNNFKIPNLQGYTPIDAGTGVGLMPRVIATTYGTETVTISDSAMLGMHDHVVNAELPSNTASLRSLVATPGPSNALSRAINSQFQNVNSYAPLVSAAMTPFDPTMVVPVGPTDDIPQPHENRQPFLVMTCCICLFGEWPDPPNS